MLGMQINPGGEYAVQTAIHELSSEGTAIHEMTAPDVAAEAQTDVAAKAHSGRMSLGGMGSPDAKPSRDEGPLQWFSDAYQRAVAKVEATLKGSPPNRPSGAHSTPDRVVATASADVASVAAPPAATSTAESGPRAAHQLAYSLLNADLTKLEDEECEELKVVLLMVLDNVQVKLGEAEKRRKQEELLRSLTEPEAAAAPVAAAAAAAAAAGGTAAAASAGGLFDDTTSGAAASMNDLAITACV